MSLFQKYQITIEKLEEEILLLHDSSILMMVMIKKALLRMGYENLRYIM